VIKSLTVFYKSNSGNYNIVYLRNIQYSLIHSLQTII